MKKTLTLTQRIQTVDWLRTQQTANLRPADLAKAASEVLGFEVTAKAVIYMCRELDIPYARNAMPAAPAAEILALTQRVEKLEMELRILKSFYINTTKKPKEDPAQRDLFEH